MPNRNYQTAALDAVRVASVQGCNRQLYLYFVVLTWYNHIMTSPRPRHVVIDPVTGLRQWFIYCLKDPRTDAIRYVGYTSNTVESRLKRHIYDAHLVAQRYSAKWIMSLAKLGLYPKCETLETGTGDGWAEAECRWIEKLRDECRLTNLTDGGEGAHGYTPTPEMRAHLSRVFKGRTFTPEHLEKLAAAKRGTKQPPETIAKRMKNAVGRKMSPEAIEASASKRRGRTRTLESRMAQSKAITGRTLTPEHIAAISNALKGRIRSADHRKHLSESLKGKKPAPHVIEKLRAANTGKKRTPEHIAAIIAGRAGYKHSPETKAKIGLANKQRAAEKKLHVK